MPYNLDIPWVDPSEPSDAGRATERRQYPRRAVDYRLHIAAHRGPGEKPLVAKGEVLDVSVGGMCIKTRHHLEVGQVVDLAIPTRGCPDEFVLPKAFLGKARVSRVEALNETVLRAALAVEQDLLDDMAYAVFVEYPHRRSSASR